MRKIILAVAGWLGACAWGAVQNVTITADNANAYSASNKLVCDSGSKILVQYSYRAAGTTLKAGLLDFIEVTPPAEGESEPWVSIRLAGEGLQNDVDFSGQPYLWLGAAVDAIYRLNGIYTPHGDVYRFGYGEGANGESRGICVTNLVDNPDTGASRRVLVCGAGVTSFSGGNSFTGGVVIEGPAYVSVGAANGFSSAESSNPTNFVTLRNVGGNAARVNFKNANIGYTTSFRVEGTNVFHSCGSGSAAVCTVFKGAITGWGQINLTDQGGVRFTSPSNTYTGALNLMSNHTTFDMEIGFGDGENCSWVGSEVIQPNQTNAIVVVNCEEDFTLNTALSANGGRLVKKGGGTLTLGTAFPRKTILPEAPVMQIKGGCVKRTLTEPTAADGFVEISEGATLDLNQVPATSVWLPVGGGSIVNPADGVVTLKGPAHAEKSFCGSVEGKATLVETAWLPWRLAAQATFEDGLAISSGSVEVEDGFSTPELSLSSTSVARVLPHMGTDEGGLKMEVWKKGASWAGADNLEMLEAAVTYTETHAETPDFVGDMTTFDETFYSGSNNSNGVTTSAFYLALGDTYNHFVAKFSGFITIEEDGVYQFRGAADDGVRIILDGTNTVLNVAAGNATWYATADIALTAGRHPITIYFLEKTGWEVLWVGMRKSGGTWENIPVRLLTTWRGTHSNFGAVTGEGAIELAGADVPWPQMDLADFTGRLVANEYTAADSVGFVEPVNAGIHVPGAANLSGGDWWHTGPAAIVLKDGKYALDLGGVKESNAYVNRRKPLDLTKPFSVSFDFSIHQPWAGSSSLGDGFFLGFSDSMTGTYGGTFSHTETGSRLNNTAAYGLQAYLMTTYSDICWVKNNRQIGSVSTNYVYMMNNAKDRTKPFHVTLAWDLVKLVATFEQEGQAPFALTNTAAVTDLPERYPSNQAYLGLWARNGGYYCTMLFENLVVDEGEQPPASGPTSVMFNGVLGLTDGVVQVTGADDVQAVIASRLQVYGAGTLQAFAAPATSLTGAEWIFDLRAAAAKLTLTGPFTFPADQIITVDLEGEPEAKTRVLADLTGVADGAADGLRFQLDPDLPAMYRLVYENGLLKISASTGTTIFIR